MATLGDAMTPSETDARNEMEERLKFETLIAELSARFAHVAADQVDTEIRHAQQRIVEALDLDRSALWQIPEREPGVMRLASLYEAGRQVVERANHELLSSTHWMPQAGDRPPALLGMDATVFYPWLCAQLLRGERMAVSSLDELPAAAAEDKEMLRRAGAKSTVIVPLVMGGAVIGALSFAMVRNERTWPEPLLDRFQVIARVIAGALARSRAEKALRASEARLSLAAASAGARVWELEMRTGRLWVTTTAKTLYKLAPEEELTFERFLGFVHTDDREGVRDLVQHRVQVGQDIHLEYRVVRPDGRVEWVSTWGHLHGGSGGESDRLLGVSIDVTEHKRKDEELENRLREIEALKQQLERENTSLREDIRVLSPHSGIVGKSLAMRKAAALASQVAPTDSTVLITGETGTGKELIARAIHAESRRKDRPLVTVNCASLPTALIEAELFGRDKGAYTGATTAMPGRFEIADGATLFLDEIGELPLEVQAKLLRVLEDGRFERLGSSKSLRVDVRILAATNRDLAQDVKAGRFRGDLYYRLCVFPIAIPPLRERPEDIPDLAWTFIRHFEQGMGKTIRSMSKQTMDALGSYAWPGNVRELRNVIEHAMIVSPGPTLQMGLSMLTKKMSPRTLGTLQDVEREHILGVLEKTGWRLMGKGGAAEVLGLKRTTLQARMNKLGIRRPPR
jgi:formate hydrogenlyase transcriptional activator